MHAVGAVGDDVVAAFYTEVLSIFVVAAEGILLQKLG